MTLPLEGTGFKQEITPEELEDKYSTLPQYDPKLKNHFWIVTVVYAADPVNWTKGATIHFDKENLVTTAGPGCLFCEQVYNKQLAHRRCSGEPRGSRISPR